MVLVPCIHAFWSKKIGATYQRCINEKIGRGVHTYVDDIVLKSKERDDILTDLVETFINLRKYNMKMNPEKCVLGVLYAASYSASSYYSEESKSIWINVCNTEDTQAQELEGHPSADQDHCST